MFSFVRLIFDFMRLVGLYNFLILIYYFLMVRILREKNMMAGEGIA